ncbi:energy-coupling factor transporter ATPase [Ligilactobacillus araffinosus]|uniref:ABC transporter, ATP-binding protein n=1 Tax=Ligilactobacillus araffinosus DSM 20653 TaxID=1423820 RepID=A0A0R1ZRE2_9LACO|nr:energy-coupling factor transporter ATPase [Ligilactobacillus araffinosus]KRM53116.1 ABC transporter, ATP-binding protein [Ligilactobacillus araffinosus DSM 20653]
MPLIQIQDLTYEYDDFKLGPLNLEIEKDQWISVIGRNGSGKSTLARLIDGLIEAQSGTVTVDGLEVNEQNVWQIRSQIGVVFQNPDNQFVGANVEDDVAFGLENRQLSHAEMVKRVSESLEAVGMTEFAKHEPSRLSGGQKQRVAIAGILAIRPQIIILDEATSMLDPEGRRELIQLIRHLKDQYHFTVIAITHDIDETVFSDQIIVLDQGKIRMQGRPADVYRNRDQLMDLGLDLPFVEKLKFKLQENGLAELKDDEILDEKEMVAKLWQLNSNM